ncbi:MAG: lamin tail domain-containing protein [Bacteroidales bacterium]|nr:lamin tail domain-containing protein [Bacteroidales bacterium]
MKKILLLFLILPLCTSAQVVDDFSDGDFTANPAWSGTDTAFIVNTNLELQSAATTAGEAWLATPCVGRNVKGGLRHLAVSPAGRYAVPQTSLQTFLPSTNLEWRFWIRESFSPSTNNFADVWLAADTADLPQASRGYFLRFGAPGSQDAIELYRQDPDGQQHLILKGTDATIASSFKASVKINRTAEGHWTLATDFNNQGSYTVEAEGADDTYAPEGYFGFHFHYTASNARKFFFDDIYIGPETNDTITYQPAENDVVINEIMADPSPVVGLPEWEYVELFNTTDQSINLRDWAFLIGNTVKPLPSVTISPLGYLVLCKANAQPELNQYGPTCGFSSFTITNAGTTLRLQAPDESLISEVSFNDNWYHDPDKRNGGWSLEQIDPFNPCAGTANWSASTDPSGGTPGRENAINAPNLTAPRVARVNVLGDNTVLLWFDQQMDRTSLQDPQHYLVQELDIHPGEVILNPVENTSLSLTFDCRFQEGALYTLLLNGMTSCSGQPVDPDTRVRFGIPNPITSGDILINEILFNPISPCPDFVELYNPTDKTFDLSELKLGAIRESFPEPADTTLKTITDNSQLLLPASYLLLSTDGFTVCQHYGCEPDNYFDMESFPSYPNSGGTALIMSRQGIVVDQMDYNEQMHYPLLKETKGVSLERVSWETPSNQPDNWHSAAETAHFGTPGLPNSMMPAAHETAESSENPETIQVEPQVFSPDGDGFDDNCLVTYQLDTTGCTLNAYVFSADGKLIRHLVKGQLVSDQGNFVWNGLDSQGSRVPIGIYIVLTEVFDMQGNLKTYKNAVAVASY